MGFSRKIKENIILSIIEKKTKKKHNRSSFCNLKKAKMVGILFDLNNIYNFETVNKFKEELTKKGKSVKVLAKINSIKIPDTKFDKHLALYMNNDIKVNALSTNESINKFIEQPLDLLLVLNDDSSLATKYIVNLSKAHCKIGALESCYNVLDFVIEMPESTTIDKLITEIKKHIT